MSKASGPLSLAQLEEVRPVDYKIISTDTNLSLAPGSTPELLHTTQLLMVL